MTMPVKVHFLCSCPEYIHGTGKPTKKKTTCKQCKGVKLPFAPIGGTVRMLTTPYVFDATVARNCVGTVRLPSTSAYGRQRPTILCGDHDPYDYLRQSRLLYTDRSNDLNDSQQFKAAILSPHLQPMATALIRPSGHRPFSKKPSRIFESFTPIIPADPYRNRSILHTTINPYELISSTLHNNEFSPSNHAHLYDSLACDNANDIHNVHNGKSNGTVALRSRNETKRFNVLETFRPNDLETVKSLSLSTTPTRQPPPVPALESLPLSVKLITGNVSKNVDATVTATATKCKTIGPSATNTISKYKSILKQPLVPARANVHSITDQTTKDKNSENKLNGKRSFSQTLLDEGRHTNSTFKSSIQKSNPKLNGSLQSINAMGNGFKRIIKEPKTVHIVSGSATTGRCKKVQFNPEPVLVSPKSIDENIGSGRFVKENGNSVGVSASKTTPDKCNNNQARLENVGNDSMKIIAQEIGKRCELNRGSQQRKPIQRSMSDRRDKSISDKLNFKDTTALRTKQVRASPEQLFQKPLISKCQRPTSPPPKLPTDNNSRKSTALPQRPPRQQKKSTTKSVVPTGTTVATTTTTTTTTTTQSKIDDAKAARIFGLLPVSTINQNKIKIQPFSNSDIKPVKPVANESSKGGGDSSIQKTSITINSEDCASTINVSDRVKLYHSSVLIKNENVATECEQMPESEEKTGTSTNPFSTALTLATPTTVESITESIGAPVAAVVEDSPTEIAIIYHNNKNGKSNDVLETISTNVSKTKTLICLDYKNKSDDAEQMLTPENGSVSARVSSPSDSNKSLNSLNGSMRMKPFADSFILKLLNDPYLSYLLHGLEIKTIAKIIENSLVRLRAHKHDIKSRATKDTTEMDKLFLNRLHDIIKEERTKIDQTEQTTNGGSNINNNNNNNNNRISSSIENSINSRLRPSIPSIDYYQNELIQDANGLYDGKAIPVRKLYEMLVDSTFWITGDSSSSGDSQSTDHQYESICLNCDPIYEEINDKPPPLPINPPPMSNSNAIEKQYKPMFLGATKYDILSYLVDAKERGIVPEESYTFKFLRRPIDDTAPLEIIPEDSSRKVLTIVRNRDSTGSSTSGGTKSLPFQDEHLNIKSYSTDKCMTSIERNDSGVGSETSKTSRTKYQPNIIEHKTVPPIRLCEDCDDPIELQILETNDMYTAIVCRNCMSKRRERREILWEFIETEKKYSRDLQIIIDEFHQPILVAGLLTQDQLSAIFLNIEELLENSEAFCAKIRDAFDAANEQADDDLFTVDIGKIILETTSMLCAFESYCIQQAAASLLLANMEKDKELLRIFLRVSQMENTVLRRMNLNSFLMVPVQRVTKYPLLLARLYKVTPPHLESRERLKEAQDKIECHLNRMNREAKDISTKLWRRLSSNPTRARENDIVNIKLRKIAMDLLDWSHDKIHFIVEGKLLITHPTDNNWRKGRTIKLTPVNALLITNELASTSSSDRTMVNFPRYSTSKETAFLLLREKSGRYTLYREPFYLDRCVVCTESDSAEYFEVHEIASKDSFIFKADDDSRTKHWYTQLRYHAQGTGAWRKRRTALANIMINGMMLRS